MQICSQFESNNITKYFQHPKLFYTNQFSIIPMPTKRRLSFQMGQTNAKHFARRKERKQKRSAYLVGMNFQFMTSLLSLAAPLWLLRLMGSPSPSLGAHPPRTKNLIFPPRRLIFSPGAFVVVSWRASGALDDLSQ